MDDKVSSLPYQENHYGAFVVDDDASVEKTSTLASGKAEADALVARLCIRLHIQRS